MRITSQILEHRKIEQHEGACVRMSMSIQNLNLCVLEMWLNGLRYAVYK